MDLFDKQAKIVIPPLYDVALIFMEGISRVSLNGKEGYINKKGEQYWED